MATMQIQKAPLSTRMLKVLRLNFADLFAAATRPLAILTVMLAVTFTLDAINVAFSSNDGEIYFAPELFLIIYLFVIANQTFYHQFPMAMSFGISRRDFYLGTLLGFAIQAVWYSIVTLLIGLLRGSLVLYGFSPIAEVNDFLGLIWAFMAVQLVSGAITTIYLRWGRVGMFTFFTLVALVFIATPIAITYLTLWDAFLQLAAVDLSEIDALIASSVTGGVIALFGYLFIRKAAVH
jgi:uncharacterized membrane protein